MKLIRAIFDRYDRNWQSMERELDVLAQVSGVPQEDISLYMKGLYNSLSVISRVKICEFLALDPNDFPELAYSAKKE